jgi:thiamine transporter
MQSKIRKMAEASMLVALATVLSVIKLVEMPYGGSITFASMLPIVIIAYRHGNGWGLVSGMLYGVIQQLLGLNSLSYFTTWYSILAVMLLDYVLAFTVLGFSGAFRKSVGTQSHAMILGSLLACLLRYVLHTVAGCTVWAGLSIPTEAALVYSIGYNATYMIPETLITAIAAWYLFSLIDFSSPRLKRVQSKREDALPVPARNCYRASLLFGVIGVCYAIIRIFPLLQDDGGNFNFSGIKNLETVSFFSVIAVFAAAVVILYTVATILKNKKVKN